MQEDPSICAAVLKAAGKKTSSGRRRSSGSGIDLGHAAELRHPPSDCAADLIEGGVSVVGGELVRQAEAAADRAEAERVRRVEVGRVDVGVLRDGQVAEDAAAAVVEDDHHQVGLELREQREPVEVVHAREVADEQRAAGGRADGRADGRVQDAWLGLGLG